jgi:hypothetical protein
VIGPHRFRGSEWVDMVSTTGPTNERCELSACGLSVDTLQAGTFWPPGGWIVVAPTVKGWIEPLPLKITVSRERLTSFTLRYRRAAGPQTPWPTGLFEKAEFPPQLGVVFENVWQGVVHGEYLAVFAGSRTEGDSLAPSDHGLILVEIIEPKTWRHRFVSVDAPIPGPIRIVRVMGHVLEVRSPSGAEAAFDVDARRFV